MGIIERFRGLPRGGVDPARAVRVREGTLAEYDALALWHYRAGRPATCVRVLTAEAEGEAVGVLVVSMPTLNGRWRRAAWPDLATGDARERARALNERVRAITRVVVEPRWRGLGIATRLVRAYLARPLTERTEAVAAMGACCPFFARAGMTAWRPGPDQRDARLLAALRAEGMEAWELAGPRRLSPRAARALAVWADASRATRGMSEKEARAAAAGIGEMVAFTAESGELKAEMKATAPRLRSGLGQGAALGAGGVGGKGREGVGAMGAQMRLVREGRGVHAAKDERGVERCNQW